MFVINAVRHLSCATLVAFLFLFHTRGLICQEQQLKEQKYVCAIDDKTKNEGSTAANSIHNQTAEV